MRRIILLNAVLSVLLVLACNAPVKKNEPPAANKTDIKPVGGGCEAGYCDLMYKGMPVVLNATDTSPGWYEKGQKLIIKGIVYKIDGITPAAGVIIYYHHTDNNGYYTPANNNRPENNTRHGHIRGWLKTGSDGRYTLYTIRPAPYPKQRLPAHIHLMVKEPTIKNEYWIDDINFNDDSLLKRSLKTTPPQQRCGNGIVKILEKTSIQNAEHKIILGLNIPNYPQQ